MIELADKICIGNSDDAYNCEKLNVGAVLNVAQDLEPVCSWPEVDYTHVGLIDGPGNESVDYCAAVMVLSLLIRRRGDKDYLIMIYDHDGGRSLVIALMYLSLKTGRRGNVPSMPQVWTGWKENYDKIKADNLPKVHPSHIEAFEKLPFGLLEMLI